jgi:NAD(P)-dependent dehydrogenase (short-subunit alcohol dehydrogenase family)
MVEGEVLNMSRVLLVTGSSGIAEHTALLAAASVFIVGREEKECRSLSERIPGSGWFACDLRDESGVAQAVKACLDRFGRVDALFNVAGISGRRFGDGPVHECSLEGWEVTLGTNVRSMFLMCREVIRHWLGAQQEGAILNMASVLAFSPASTHFATHAYAASKGAVISLTRSMAAYYAPHKIRVNAIAPALVRTPMSLRAQSDASVVEYVAHKQPLSGGMLEPAEVAKAALFLLGEDSRHMTGQVLTIDGGWSVSD